MKNNGACVKDDLRSEKRKRVLTSVGFQSGLLLKSGINGQVVSRLRVGHCRKGTSQEDLIVLLRSLLCF